MSDRERSLTPGQLSPGRLSHHDKSPTPRMSRSRSRDRTPPSRSMTPPPRRSRSHSHHSRHNRRSYSRSRSRSRSRRYRSSRYHSRSRSRSPRRRRYNSRGRRSPSRSPMSNRRRHVGNRENPPATRCLGVFGLSLYTQERDLRDVFTKYGALEEVQVVYDAQNTSKTGKSRGFAFVYFENTEDAQTAKERCNGLEVDGRRIRVDFSITQRAHTPTPGIYMGKPTYGGGGSGSSGGGSGGGGGGGGGSGGGGGGGGGGCSGGGGGSGRYSAYRGRSPSPYYKRSRYSRSRSRSYSPRVGRRHDDYY